MLDIDFYMKFDDIMTKIKNKEFKNKNEIYNNLEKIRNESPIIYNIETTNRCNMRCEMCPRTTMMTRKIEDIDKETFSKIIDQIEPHSLKLWQKWKRYCENKYGIAETDEPSENHFFLYIISKVIQLHGYGDPLLDRHMHEYVKILHDKGFSSYFSCNPANINLDLTYKMLDAGLDYIKYSIESVDDAEHKKIRGEASDFGDSYEKIKQVLKYKHEHNLHTTIIITMLNLNRTNQDIEFKRLIDAFSGLDTYVYLKSEDCQWYRKDYHQTASIHWSEICKHPWMTMTVKSNGEIAMCMEDYNNEIVFGNAKTELLKDIWNNDRYTEFRWQHIMVDEHIKCNHECDMQLIGEVGNV